MELLVLSFFRNAHKEAVSSSGQRYGELILDRIASYIKCQNIQVHSVNITQINISYIN